MKKKKSFLNPPVLKKLKKPDINCVTLFKQAHRFSFTPSGAVKSFYMTSFRPPAAALVSTQQPQIPQ